MFIDKDSVMINGVSIGQYITEITYGFFDTWSSDTGYNTNSGKFTGTFIGTYPKFTMKFKSLTPTEITNLTNIFRVPQQTVVYDDPDGTRKTITTHKGDLQLNFYAIDKSNPFQYELVGNDKL